MVTPIDNRTEVDFHHEVISRYIPALIKLVMHKGEQYSGGEQPALINFYEGSKLANDTASHYLIVQATKQWFVISKWSLFGNTLDVVRQEIVQRIFDVVVYLFLLLFMIEQAGEQPLPKDDVAG